MLISVPFVAAVLVLAFNDHVLKGLWPGLVTGKLSDVAGVAMMAILVAASTRRPALAFGATAVAFAALKTVPAVAVMATPVLGGTTRTDPGDLIALVVLFPLWWWIADRPIRVESVDRRWLFPLQIVVVSAAVFATTATSCEGEGVLSLATVDGVAYATTVGDVYESFDGGATWERSTVPSWDERLQRGFPENRVSCLGEDPCFEIVRPGSGQPDVFTIDELSEGDRTSILTATAAQRRELFDVVRPKCGDYFFDTITSVDLADGDHVLVSMGAAGVLHLRPDREWEWVAVGDHGLRPDEVDLEPFGFVAASTASNDPWEGWPATLAAVFLVLAPLAVALAIVPIVRLARRHGRDPAFGVVASVAVALCLALIGLVVYFITEGFENPRGRAIAAGAMTGVAVATVGSLLAWYGRPRGAARWGPPDVAQRAG